MVLQQVLVLNQAPLQLYLLRHCGTCLIGFLVSYKRKGSSLIHTNVCLYDFTF